MCRQRWTADNDVMFKIRSDGIMCRCFLFFRRRTQTLTRSGDTPHVLYFSYLEWIILTFLFSPLWPLTFYHFPRILQQQNEDLQRRLSLSNHRMEAMEAEFDGSRHYMEAELSRTRDDLDKMRDKFRRWRPVMLCAVIKPRLIRLRLWLWLSLLLFHFWRLTEIKSYLMQLNEKPTCRLKGWRWLDCPCSATFYIFVSSL